MAKEFGATVGAKFKPRLNKESSSSVNVMEDRLYIFKSQDFVWTWNVWIYPLSCLFVVLLLLGLDWGESIKKDASGAVIKGVGV